MRPPPAILTRLFAGTLAPFLPCCFSFAARSVFSACLCTSRFCLSDLITFSMPEISFSTRLLYEIDSLNITRYLARVSSWRSSTWSSLSLSGTAGLEAPSSLVTPCGARSSTESGRSLPQMRSYPPQRSAWRYWTPLTGSCSSGRLWTTGPWGFGSRCCGRYRSGRLCSCPSESLCAGCRGWSRRIDSGHAACCYARWLWPSACSWSFTACRHPFPLRFPRRLFPVC